MPPPRQLPHFQPIGESNPLAPEKVEHVEARSEPKNVPPAKKIYTSHKDCLAASNTKHTL
jgi:hypothetical protein